VAARKSCDGIRQRVRWRPDQHQTTHCRLHPHKFLSAPISDMRGRCEHSPEQPSPAGDTDIEADPSYRAGVAVLPPRCIRPKDTPQVLPRANHQSHARRGITGQPSDSNRLSLRERRPCESSHGRTQHRQTADFRIYHFSKSLRLWLQRAGGAFMSASSLQASNISATASMTLL
jgi:hypothetical protein